jgi:hypothetical protein
MARTIKKAPIDWTFDYYKLAADAWPTDAPTGTTVLVYDPAILMGVPYVTPDDGVTWIANSINIVLDAADLAAIAAQVSAQIIAAGLATAASVGAVGDTATAASLSDIATTSLHAKVRRVLLWLSDNLGVLATAAHTGAIDAATTIMGYVKQLVTQLLITDGKIDTLDTVADSINASKVAYVGTVTNAVSTTHFHASGLIGAVGDDFFEGWTIYVNWDSAGAGGVPQGESQVCSAYANADGGFTHPAFTTPLVNGDMVMMIHPALASTLNLNNKLGAYTGDGGAGADDSVKAQLDLLQALPASVLAAVAYTRQAGVMQVKATTFELNQAAATYTLLTGTTQDIEIESVTVRNLTDMTAGNTTSFSVQTNDTTAQTFISNTSAVKASLTVGAQFSWVGSCILKATKLIQLTVNGAACGGTDVMDVVVVFRAITSGGYLV